MTLLLRKILSQMKNICKPQKNFLQLLFEAMLASHGKLNYRNLSRYSKMSEKTISRNYRKEFNFLRLNELLIEEAGFDARRCVAVFDPSFIKKSGKKTHGLGKFWNGSNSRAEKGLEIGCLAIIDVETKQSLTVAAKQTEPIATKDENRVDCYIRQIVESVSYIQKRVQHLVVDGFFYNGRFVDAIVKTGLDVIGKVQSNACLLVPFTGTQKKGRGRPRKYVGRFDQNDTDQYDEKAVLPGNICLFSAIVYSKALGRNIKIVSAYHLSTDKKIGTYFSTDLQLSLEDIYRFYTVRYQIEFCFRDAKQQTGLMDCQSPDSRALAFHFNASLSLLNLVKVDDYLKRKPQASHSVSVASYKCQYFNKSFIERFFPRVLFSHIPKKYDDIYQEALNYGVISK